jgi:hypothetical protein
MLTRPEPSRPRIFTATPGFWGFSRVNVPGIARSTSPVSNCPKVSSSLLPAVLTEAGVL